MTPSAFRRFGGGLVLAGALAACGTTVPVGQGPAAGLPSSDSGLARQPRAAAGGAAPGAGSAAVPGAVTSGAGTSGPTSTPSTGAGPTSGTTAAPAPAGVPVVVRNGPGVTATEIRIGVPYSNDEQAANEAAGGPHQDTSGDARQYWNAAIADINARGGVAGRRVVPVYFNIHVITSQSADQQMQQVCSAWYEDTKVFVAMGAGGYPVLNKCTAAAGAVALDGGGANSDADFAAYPGFFDTLHPSLDRAARVSVEGLDRAGYFAGVKRVGVVTWDTSWFRHAVQQNLEPAMRRLGVQPLTVYLQPPNSYGDVGAAAAAIKSAQFQMASAGIDHVIPFEGLTQYAGGGFMLFFFSQYAESQHYRPRYGLNTNNTPVGATAQVDPNQLANSVGVGWFPALDLAATDDKVTGSSADAKACIAVMRKRGIDMTSEAARNSAYGACDPLRLLQRLLQGARTIDRSVFVTRMEALGGGYRNSFTAETFFAPGHHDGTRRAQTFAYGSACDCFRYTSAPFEI